MNENEKLEKDANIANLKIAFWLFVPGVVWWLLGLLLFKHLEESSAIIDFFAIFAVIPFGAAIIGSFIFLALLLGQIYKIKVIKIFVDGTVSLVSELFMMALGAVIIVLAIYLTYLFVLWAGLIGTLLTIIAALLFVLVLLSASRR